MARLLIRGACVLTLGTSLPNYPAADVLLDDGLITEISEGLRARDAEVVEAADAIVMPGFVDTHRHSVMSLFRNLGDTATAIAGTSIASRLKAMRPSEVESDLDQSWKRPRTSRVERRPNES